MQMSDCAHQQAVPTGQQHQVGQELPNSGEPLDKTRAMPHDLQLEIAAVKLQKLGHETLVLDDHDPPDAGIATALTAW